MATQKAKVKQIDFQTVNQLLKKVWNMQQENPKIEIADINLTKRVATLSC